MFGAPLDVTDGSNYSCTTNPQTNQQNCTGTFNYPDNYTFCWPDPGVKGGCGSIISGITIEVKSVRPLNATPDQWNNTVTFNFDQYNSSTGWVNQSPPYIYFYLIDKGGTAQTPPTSYFSR
jgi:hypothetical protein